MRSGRPISFCTMFFVFELQKLGNWILIGSFLLEDEGAQKVVLPCVHRSYFSVKNLIWCTSICLLTSDHNGISSRWIAPGKFSKTSYYSAQELWHLYPQKLDDMKCYLLSSICKFLGTSNINKDAKTLYHDLPLLCKKVLGANCIFKRFQVLFWNISWDFQMSFDVF